MPSVPFQVVENTYVLRTVTAEVASSSLVVPAIFSKDLHLGLSSFCVQLACGEDFSRTDSFLLMPFAALPQTNVVSSSRVVPAISFQALAKSLAFPARFA
jgi:hypothetical protein